MIQPILDRFYEIHAHAETRQLPDAQRLVLASLTAGRTPGELAKFTQIAEAFGQHLPKFSQTHALRFFPAAFLCRTPLEAQAETARFVTVYEEVRAEKLAPLTPPVEVYTALILHVQEIGRPSAPLPERIRQIKEAYQAWKKRYPSLTTPYLMPAITLNLSGGQSAQQLVTAAEQTYRELLAHDLSQSLPTMQYAWLLTLHNLSATQAGPRFLQIRDLLARLYADAPSAAYMLSLYNAAPADSAEETGIRYEKLQAEPALRSITPSLLVRTAAQAWLHECCAEAAASDALTALQTGGHGLGIAIDLGELAVIASLSGTVGDGGVEDCGGE